MSIFDTFLNTNSLLGSHLLNTFIKPSVIELGTSGVEESESGLS